MRRGPAAAAFSGSESVQKWRALGSASSCCWGDRHSWAGIPGAKGAEHAHGRQDLWQGAGGGHRKCWRPVSVAGSGCLCGSDSTVVERGLSAETIWHQCPSRQDPLREGWSRRRRQCLMLTRCGVCLLLECLICSAVASKILTVPLRTGLSTAGGDLGDSVIELKVPYVIGASQVVRSRICLPMQETQEMWVCSLGREDSPEKEMAPYSSVLAWRIPWTEEPGGLQSMGSQGVGHD